MKEHTVLLLQPAGETNVSKQLPLNFKKLLFILTPIVLVFASFYAVFFAAYLISQSVYTMISTVFKSANKFLNTLTNIMSYIGGIIVFILSLIYHIVYLPGFLVISFRVFKEYILEDACFLYTLKHNVKNSLSYR